MTDATVTVWDPAEGLAIARCYRARYRDPKHREAADHPSACQWCIYPADELEGLVASFNHWAGWNDRARRYDRFEVAAFRELKPDVQEALITAAQELTGELWPPAVAIVSKPEEEPMPASDSVPVDAAVPERPSWL